MSDPHAFSERGQESYGDIPTDPDAFLTWASRQPREAGRFELTRQGNVVMQAGTSRYHNTICMNIYETLRKRLSRKVFGINHADFALKMARSVRYPDIVVDRPAKFENTLAASNVIFVAEVLSPASIVTDLVQKAGEYQEIESLRSYLVCSQEEPRIYVWNRRRDRSWPVDPKEMVGRACSVKLAGLSIELNLAEIYRDVPVEIRGD
jgi:Uma2 family endonuclease